MKFKILFPGGYRVTDVLNDNIDINVITPDNKVYFATLFTIDNIRSLMERDNANYFWATDMIIAADLRRSTIEQIVEAIIKDDCLNNAMTEIETVTTIYSK